MAENSTAAEVQSAAGASKGTNTNDRSTSRCVPGDGARALLALDELLKLDQHRTRGRRENIYQWFRHVRREFAHDVSSAVRAAAAGAITGAAVAGNGER